MKFKKERLALLWAFALPFFGAAKAQEALSPQMAEFYERFYPLSSHRYLMDDSLKSSVPAFEQGNLTLHPNGTFTFDRKNFGIWEHLGDSAVILNTEPRLSKIVEVESTDSTRSVYFYNHYGQPFGFSGDVHVNYPDGPIYDTAPIDFRLFMDNGDTIKVQEYRAKSLVGYNHHRYALPSEAVGFMVGGSFLKTLKIDSLNLTNHDYVVFISEMRNFDHVILNKSGNRLSYVLEDGTKINDCLIDEECIAFYGTGTGEYIEIRKDGAFFYRLPGDIYRGCRGLWHIDKSGRLILTTQDKDPETFSFIVDGFRLIDAADNRVYIPR